MEDIVRAEANEVVEIDIWAMCKELFRKWYIIILAGIACGILLMLFTLIKSGTRYVSTGSAYLLSKTDRSTAITSAELSASAALAGDFAQVLRSNDVMKETIDTLGLKLTPAALKDKVTVTNDSGTRVVRLQVSDKNAQQAQKIAQTIFECANSKASNISSTLHVTIIDEPTLPRTVTRPSMKGALVKGVLLGVVLACAYFVIMWFIRQPMRDEREAANCLKTMNLGSIPAEKM